MEFLTGLLACFVLVPACVLAVEIAAATRRRVVAPGDADDEADCADCPRIAVLMPAHDEASGIAAAISGVRPQLRNGDRLLVVADNCGDGTARIARDAGAEVIERFDPERRGKGYALDYGVRHLEADPPEVVVVVDADCLLHEAALARLARLADRLHRPVQALYLMGGPAHAGLKRRMTEFAWRVRNQLRPGGLLRLGLPCQLMGTGMAFPWHLLRTAPLASGHLVEDLKLGLDLASVGAPPCFCPGALVTSTFAQHAEGETAQRTRWEHGHLSVIVASSLPLLWQALRTGRPALFALALDLCVPPLASLVLAALLVAVLAAVPVAFGGPVWPLAVAGLSLVLVGASVLCAWQRGGRDLLSFRELLSAPLYVVLKIPFYLRMLIWRQTTWVRTHRGPAPQQEPTHRVGPGP
jgi:cellulose synthase/poly-beta-1,6-N-acetylglucosamine synthase-like glycosyltransferase